MILATLCMDGFEGFGGSEAASHDLCNCCMWLMICVTCPISIPLMGLWWCCQFMCPIGPDGCFGSGEEGMGFANYADTI